MSEKTRDLGLTAYDDLFETDEGRQKAKLAKIYEVELSKIDDFPGHPFEVRMDNDMEQLVQSIKEQGVITPVILREKEGGRYEIVSGHRRKKACELAGIQTIKAEIKELTLDESIILMVDSNLQRSTILPSEKAYSYKMRLEAMKRQAGRPSKENASPLATNLPMGRSDEELAKVVGEGKDNIRRYIRLTELDSLLLKMVDENKIAFRPAVELSYLSKLQQQALYKTMEIEEATPSLAQAIKMKKFAQEGKLNDDVILSIMSEEKPNQKEKISFKMERLQKYIPENISYTQTEEYVIKALEYYNIYREKQRDKER